MTGSHGEQSSVSQLEHEKLTTRVRDDCEYARFPTAKYPLLRPVRLLGFADSIFLPHFESNTVMDSNNVEYGYGFKYCRIRMQNRYLGFGFGYLLDI